MRYYFDPAENRYHLNYLSGFTSGSPVPSGNEGGQSLSVWDFRSCAADVVSKWRAANTRPRCDKGGAGLLLPAGSVDP
jgi:hypothetical protein